MSAVRVFQYYSLAVNAFLFDQILISFNSQLEDKIQRHKRTGERVLWTKKKFSNKLEPQRAQSPHRSLP